MRKAKKRKKYLYIKRVADVMFSAILLFLLAVPMVIIWIAVRADSDGCGIFKQLRVGKDGKEFVCYKFRTMYEDAPHDCPSSKLEDGQKYVTHVGKFLRRSSLDELPQLFNVLAGDMSLVGPRPLIPQEIEVHSARRERGVYSIRPGITGLSQIMGRDNIDDHTKIELDAQYLLNIGFVEDARILAITVGNVLRAKDVAR